MDRIKACCCTGHRPQKFPFKYGGDSENYLSYLRELEKRIEYAIESCGINRFVSGMALGVDADFAAVVLKYRERYPIELECAVPCRDQARLWGKRDKLRYEEILRRADKVTFVSEEYSSDCMLKRNRYMVDKSELVIAVFNGTKSGGTWYTINYARRSGKQVEIIDLNKGESLL